MLAVLLVELELVLLELEELILEAELELELELLGATTFVAKAGNEDDFLPSLTEMTTLLYVPMAAVLGTPLRFLVTVLNCAQPGLLVTLKPSHANSKVVTRRKCIPALTRLMSVPHQTFKDFRDRLE